MRFSTRNIFLRHIDNLTFSIMVTGIVYNLILAPQYGMYFGSFFKAYSMSVTILHVVVPLLAFISYILFDENPFKRKFNLLGYTMPFLYFLFIIVLSVVSTNDYIFDGMDGSPSRFPYFFLDYIHNGWFTLTGNIAKLGTFYWLLISLVLVIAISQLLRFIQRKIFQSKFIKNIFFVQKIELEENESILNNPPDVEAIFEFNGERKTAAADGYRTTHLICDDYLTTGIHHYYEVSSVSPNGKAKGTITFIAPDSYPHSLWIGKRINIQEGYKIVGYATITEIFNPILEAEN